MLIVFYSILNVFKTRVYVFLVLIIIQKHEWDNIRCGKCYFVFKSDYNS